jgi:hypothetical protein
MVQRVPPEWMCSISAYNRMIINPSFYLLFSTYTHLLIHEPDALVVSDHLLHWCNQPIDFIGAPWFEGFSNPLPDSPIVGVGNSGFSLLRIEALLRFLSSTDRWITRKLVLWQLFSKFRGHYSRYSFLALIRMLGRAGSMVEAYRVLADHCDGFISEFSSKVSPHLRIASSHQALLFSWEANLRTCYRLTGGRLPFGLHAWKRYDPDFVAELLPALRLP